MRSFTSTHFRLDRLADGVYAAIHSEGGWAQSNAGLIDLGDRALIFDTFITPTAAKDLRSAAKTLLSCPISAVINSHYHNDHIWGNQTFPADVPIISTKKTRELITTLGAEEYQWCQEHSQERLSALEAQLDQETDEVAHRLTSYVITYYRVIIASLPRLEVRLPDLTFVDVLEFIGPRRVAQLITFGGGHTGSDAILYLPEERIIFMGDLLFIGVHPYLPDGDPDEMRRTLTKIAELPAKTLVPGHGPVGSTADLQRMVEYLDTLESLLRQAMTNGVEEEMIAKIHMPETYREWIFPSFFPANLMFLHKRRTRGGPATSE